MIERQYHSNMICNTISKWLRWKVEIMHTINWSGLYLYRISNYLVIWGSYGMALHAKGQIKPRADWRAIDSPKKRTNEFLFFLLYSPEILETWNFDFKFQVFPDGHGKKTKFVSSFFGRIYGAPICFRFYLTFRSFQL